MKPLIYQNKTIKNILFLGFGISNQTCFSFLEKNYSVNAIIYDQKKINFKNPNILRIINDLNLIKNDFQKIDLIITSPGLDLRKNEFSLLSEINIPIINDIELFGFLNDRDFQVPIVAITGSNGKSTVTTLVFEMLQAVGIKTAFGGNIGVGVFDLLNNYSNYDCFVLELSSFQLERIKSLHVTVGAMTNLSKDHLDRYDHLDVYHQTKLQLVQLSQYFICHQNIAHLLKHHENIIYYNLVNNTLRLFIENHLNLQGRHNIDNALCAWTIIKTFLTKKHIEIINFKEKMISTLENFKALPSRCNLIKTNDGLIWIDDSKGTNIDSTKAAILGLNQNKKNIHLILGGIDKNGDFSELQTLIDQYISHIYLFGKDQLKIKKQIKHQDIYLYKHLDLIIPQIKKRASKGDLILFSPACASFDQFDNYLHRGRYFKELVLNKR